MYKFDTPASEFLSLETNCLLFSAELNNHNLMVDRITDFGMVSEIFYACDLVSNENNL